MVEDQGVRAAAGGSEPASGASVGIIMGSDSDLPTMRAAAEALDEFGIASEVTVVSAHRTPDRMLEYARSAHQRGIQVSFRSGCRTAASC
jgi:phosphoribosylaminoimidazole carboxylase PurE protein